MVKGCVKKKEKYSAVVKVRDDDYWQSGRVTDTDE